MRIVAENYGLASEQVNWLLDAADHPAVGTLYDPCNYHRIGEDPLSALKNLGQRVYHCHLKDAFYNAPRDPDSLFEGPRWPPSVAVGEGEIEWGPILSELATFYDGYLCIEYEIAKDVVRGTRRPSLPAGQQLGHHRDEPWYHQPHQRRWQNEARNRPYRSPHGLASDADGNLWVAESKFPALLKVTMDGGVTTVSKGNADLPFLWPNDLSFGPDGTIYMTDSGVLLDAFEGIEPPDAAYDMPIDGHVFRIDLVSGVCRLLDRGLRFANGIAFGPGGEDLYVSETLTGNVYRYKIVEGKVRGAAVVWQCDD